MGGRRPVIDTDCAHSSRRSAELWSRKWRAQTALSAIAQLTAATVAPALAGAAAVVAAAQPAAAAVTASPPPPSHSRPRHRRSERRRRLCKPDTLLDLRCKSPT